MVDPAILLLDEATSNLDLGTEARVQRASLLYDQGDLDTGHACLLGAQRLEVFGQDIPAPARQGEHLGGPGECDDASRADADPDFGQATGSRGEAHRVRVERVGDVDVLCQPHQVADRLSVGDRAEVVG